MTDLATDIAPAADDTVVDAVVDNGAPAPKTYDPNEPVDVEDFYRDDKPKAGEDLQDPDRSDGAEDGSVAEDEGADQPEPIDAPLSWAKDAKEKWADIPRETQEIIATREKERETFLQSKSREAAQTRQAVETEARTALMTIMQNHEQQLQPLIQQFTPKQPDLALLNSEDPAERNLYFQQEAAYRYNVAQQDALQQQLAETRQHAEVIAQHQRNAELEAEHAMLNDTLGTEWSDPSTRAKLLSDLRPIAAELGYPAELIANARGVDIIAMKHVATLKAKADKYDALQKAKMVPVRAAKGAIPPTARTGSPTGQQAAVDTAAQLYPNDVRRN